LKVEHEFFNTLPFINWRYYLALDAINGMCSVRLMTIRTEIGSSQLAELVEQVKAGNEVLLTESNRPVAKLVAAVQNGNPTSASFRIRSFAGHRVLTPVISQADLADEMFGTR
jgi:antitoxin (DNA-binding transcriptional repressor) of toxin-antitoxin stability system